MTKVHFLNVGSGDCIIMEHGSGRVTMFDICGGNRPRDPLTVALRQRGIPAAAGGWRMCDQPLNPLDFLESAKIDGIHRFILSHPECDHLDGFDALMNAHGVSNFWHTGAERPKPTFRGSPFREEDWNRYERVRHGKQANTKSLLIRAGARFRYANPAESSDDHDGLYILAPDNGLIEAAVLTGDFNDASYVLLYRSPGGRVLVPGDAHDATWEYLLRHHESDVSDVSLLIAPHHGRKSERDYGFLDVVRPQLTLFGCAPSEHLAYDAWRHRNLEVITNNQAGCVTAECTDGEMTIYVENRTFAEEEVGSSLLINSMGYYAVRTIAAIPQPVKQRR